MYTKLEDEEGNTLVINYSEPLKAAKNYSTTINSNILLLNKGASTYHTVSINPVVKTSKEVSEGGTSPQTKTQEFWF